LLAQEKYVIA